jgi:hypothetical protein
MFRFEEEQFQVVTQLLIKAMLGRQLLCFSVSLKAKVELASQNGLACQDLTAPGLLYICLALSLSSLFRLLNKTAWLDMHWLARVGWWMAAIFKA